MTDPAHLPERLRLQVVALVSAVLPSVTPLPSPLRKVAAFAPARRARLGNALIWAALTDDDFRGHAGVQAAALPADVDDPVDAAARAWLSREAGWEAVVDEAVAALGEVEVRDDKSQAELRRLTAQVASLQAELAALRSGHRTELEGVKADHKVLRQRLGEARGLLRAGEVERDAALAGRDQAMAVAEAATKAAEIDVRRLRAQLEEAEAGLAATRRDVRTERDAATIRARLLLDAVVESATGLRRELGLPSVSGVPGEAVESELAGIDAAPTSSAPASPALLEQMLSKLHCVERLYLGALAFVGFHPLHLRNCGFAWGGSRAYERYGCAATGAHPPVPFALGQLQVMAAPLAARLAASAEARALADRAEDQPNTNANEDAAIGLMVSRLRNVTYVSLSKNSWHNLGCFPTSGMYRPPAANSSVVVHRLITIAALRYAWSVLRDGARPNVVTCHNAALKWSEGGVERLRGWCKLCTADETWKLPGKAPRGCDDLGGSRYYLARLRQSCAELGFTSGASTG